MSRRRVTITCSDGALAVRGWRAGDLLQEAGTRPTWAQSAGWLLDAKHLPDVLAYLQHRHIAVTVLEETPANHDTAGAEPDGLFVIDDRGLW